MAARRVAKSTVDWAAFVERVPANQKDAFRHFKAKSDNFIAKVYKYPEKPAEINWQLYRSRITTPGLVDQFEKAYQSVKIPYPTDKQNLKSQVDAQQKEAEIITKKNIVEAKKVIDDAKALLAKIDSVPPLEEMTHEMYAEYFPEQALDPVQRPTFWPHNKAAQPGYDPEHEIK